jgi:glycerophosphoryl diester phosphodiesterase
MGRQEIIARHGNSDSRRLIFTLAAVALSSAAGCSTGQIGHPKASDSPAPAFIVQSHRGAGNLAPENTVQAFELAWSIGSVPEADVRTTKDGEIVAFHDADFNRLVKGALPNVRDKGVCDLTWAEVATLDVGSWKGSEYAGQRIPRIRDVFKIMRDRPERWLYLDVKSVLLSRLAELARHYRVQRQVILASTYREELVAWKELLPEAKTLLWMSGPEAKLTNRLQTLRSVNFKAVTQLQIHVQVGDLNAGDPFTPSSAFLRSVAAEMGQRGICFQVLPRGLDHAPVYARLMDLGAESFATDDPKAALEAVRQYRRGVGQ